MTLNAESSDINQPKQIGRNAHILREYYSVRVPTNISESALGRSSYRDLLTPISWHMLVDILVGSCSYNVLESFTILVQSVMEQFQMILVPYTSTFVPAASCTDKGANSQCFF